LAIRYENAPITEALIDIQVALPEGLTTSALDPVYDHVKGQYPMKKKRVHLQSQLSVGEDVSAVTKHTLMGFSFSSEDGKQVLQARLNGFTFSRLRPYITWPQLRDEAHRLWDIYRRILDPTKITRVAVRYINQIDIPLSSIDHKDYFRTFPEVSPDLPQVLTGFFLQLRFPQQDFGGLLILTQTTQVSSAGPSVVSVILDLDVFKENNIDSDEESWNLLEILRDRKNEFFEACITDRTRALFGERIEY
jgi:uncharacterized protein (TIGR04255 family)